MAGELLVIIADRPSIGVAAATSPASSPTPRACWPSMIVILVIGIVVDALLFGTLERAIRRRWGLLESRS